MIKCLLTVKNAARQVLSGPDFYKAESVEAAVDDFTLRTKGAYLGHGHIIEVEQAGQSQSLLYFSERGEGAWAGTL